MMMMMMIISIEIVNVFITRETNDTILTKLLSRWSS